MSAANMKNQALKRNKVQMFGLGGKAHLADKFHLLFVPHAKNPHDVKAPVIASSDTQFTKAMVTQQFESKFQMELASGSLYDLLWDWYICKSEYV